MSVHSKLPLSDRELKSIAHHSCTNFAIVNATELNQLMNVDKTKRKKLFLR